MFITKLYAMKKLLFAIGVFCLVSIQVNASTPDRKVEFFTGSLISAKEKAKAENKYYFLEFYADWCKPCKWMEDNTYSNGKLAEYIQDNYVAVKINIEDFDGHALKEKYNVEYLPTIIVFNDQGQMVAKHEKSLSASQLLKILKENKSSEAIAPAPDDNTITSRESTPTTYSSSSPVKTTATAKPTTTTKSTYSTPSATQSSNTTPAGSVYRVQLGVFKDAQNVMRQVDVLKKQISDPVNIINEKNSSTGEVTYRLVAGKFNDKYSADALLNTLKSKGHNGLVKTFPSNLD